VTLVRAAIGFVATTLAWCFSGCGDDLAVCRLAADCASGVCLADGMCEPLSGDGGPDGGDTDAGAGSDSGFPACTPNFDGVVQRSEVPDQPDLGAKFRVAFDTPVDTAGDAQADGSRNWDLAGPLNMDSDMFIQRLAITGEWYEQTFANADYAIQISRQDELLGIIDERQNGVYLLGLVSPQGGALRTELAYDPAIALLRFPIDASSSWTTDSTVTGLANGVAAFYTEDYVSSVDGFGELATPFGDFPVIRIRAELTRVVGVVITTHTTLSYITECLGTVASVRAEGTDPNPTFATEVWRLTP